ncbi:hypothetical protein [Turicibacter sanguinis]|uniref:hypothetical protein n=1 Tax=Turicibacter sanguinis TaxID=154288 RepID=UPI0018AA8C37|nr:hypothetical protein [Turicibacter sanguinis]MDB8553862.1 hypothetical protein [Turicibacter sanguinis]
MINKSVKCPVCGVFDLEQTDYEVLESALDELWLSVDFQCCKCGNEFNVSASYEKPQIIYC